MYLNGFSVRIPEGVETHSGYVEMEHGKKYVLVLRNSKDIPCDAMVEIDGKEVGTWRIPCNRSITLERPSNDIGRFTFYELGTMEAEQAGLDEHSEDLGLIRVTFTPEVSRITQHVFMSPEVWQPDFENEQYYLGSSNSYGGLNRRRGRGSSAGPTPKGGGTGLSGKSEQRFGRARKIEYDYSQRTIINLRLVSRQDTPRPLKPISNPVPKRID